MAATLDDLVYLAAALRVDVRSGFDRVTESLKGANTAGESGAGNAPPASSSGSQNLKDFMSGLTKSLATIVPLMRAFDKSLQALGTALSGLVSKISPVAVLQFQIALDNFQATLGRELVPLLNTVTGMFKQLSGAFASLSDDSKKLLIGLTLGAGIGTVIAGVAAAIAGLVAAFGGLPVLIGAVAAAFAGLAAVLLTDAQISEQFNAILEGVGQVISQFAAGIIPAVREVLGAVLSVMKDLLPIFTALGEVAGMVVGAVVKIVAVVARFVIVAVKVTGVIEMMSSAIEWLTEVVSDFLDSLGLGYRVERFDPKRREGEMAVRQSQIESISSFANRAYTSALGGASVPAKTLGKLEDIDETVKDIRDFIKGVRKEPAKVAAAIGAAPAMVAGPDFAGRVRDLMREAFGGAWAR